MKIIKQLICHIKNSLCNSCQVPYVLRFVSTVSLILSNIYDCFHDRLLFCIFDKQNNWIILFLTIVL